MPSASDTTYLRLKANPTAKELDEIYTPNIFELVFAHRPGDTDATDNPQKTLQLFHRVWRAARGPLASVTATYVRAVHGAFGINIMPASALLDPTMD